jgi:uncharacterized protein (TIGR00251 family)
MGKESKVRYRKILPSNPPQQIQLGTAARQSAGAVRVHNCMSITETKDGVILTVFVKPNSAKFSVEVDGGEIVLRCTEEPVKGKVNKEIIKELTKLLHAKVELTSGATSRQKQLFVKDISKSQVEELLNSVQLHKS